MKSVISSPVVSVVLPVRDGASTIVRAIESLRRQTWTDWELLVVDDGSADGTREIVGGLAREERRIRMVGCDREGIVVALNAGLALARGEFIARMDADDEAMPERLAAQVAFLRSAAGRGVGLVSCLVEFGGDPVASAGYARHVEWINGLVTPEQIALNRFIESPLAHPSVLFRREIMDTLGGYRPGDFPEDYELWLRWLDGGVRMAKVPRVLLRWNDRPERLSRADERYDPEAFFREKARWIARWLWRNVFVSQEETEKKREETSRVSRPIWVWGAGRPTRKRASYLETYGVRVAGYIDVDPKKVTAALGGMGVPVIAPEELPAPGKVFVLGYVSSRGARELIRAALVARGYAEARDFLMCA